MKGVWSRGRHVDCVAVTFIVDWGSIAPCSSRTCDEGLGMELRDVVGKSSAKQGLRAKVWLGFPTGSRKARKGKRRSY